jgi:hypothetical protein
VVVVLAEYMVKKAKVQDLPVPVFTKLVVAAMQTIQEEVEFLTLEWVVVAMVVVEVLVQL